MSPRVYGYVVDLGDGKNLTERFDLMCASGIPSGNIFVERQGHNEIRPQLDRLLKRISPGDTLTFESIYGIGYNSGAISENLERVSRIGNVSIVLLDMPLMRACREDADQRMISNMVIETVLYMTRHLKETRELQQRKGIDSAKARGVQFGRPKIDMPDEYDVMVERWRNGEVTAEEAAHLLNISRSTFFRRAKAYTP